MEKKVKKLMKSFLPLSKLLMVSKNIIREQQNQSVFH